MSSRNNVIQFNPPKPSKKAKSLEVGHVQPAQVINQFVERRQEDIRREQRELRRTVLSEFLGAYAVIPTVGLKRVMLYDISPKGLSFDLEFELGSLNLGEEVAMRFYLSQYTYFPFTVEVTNAREIAEEGVVRHGCKLIPGSYNQEAMESFIAFLETITQSLQRDSGDFQKTFRRL